MKETKLRIKRARGKYHHNWLRRTYNARDLRRVNEKEEVFTTEEMQEIRKVASGEIEQIQKFEDRIESNGFGASLGNRMRSNEENASIERKPSRNEEEVLRLLEMAKGELVVEVRTSKQMSKPKKGKKRGSRLTLKKCKKLAKSQPAEPTQEKLDGDNSMQSESATTSPKAKVTKERAPRLSKSQKEVQKINEYRRNILMKVNEDMEKERFEEALREERQPRISFNKKKKILEFSKLIRRPLNNRGEVEVSNKDCQYKSVLKGSKETYSETVKISKVSMFHDKYTVFEADIPSSQE